MVRYKSTLKSGGGFPRPLVKNFFSCLYRASVTIKTLHYPTDAQIYNS